MNTNTGLLTMNERLKFYQGATCFSLGTMYSIAACALLISANVLASHEAVASRSSNSSQLLCTTVTSIESSWSIEMQTPSVETSSRIINQGYPMTIGVNFLESDLHSESSPTTFASSETRPKGTVGYFQDLGAGANVTTPNASIGSTSKSNASATLSISTGLGTPQYLYLPRVLVAGLALVPLILLVIV